MLPCSLKTSRMQYAEANIITANTNITDGGDNQQYIHLLLLLLDNESLFGSRHWLCARASLNFWMALCLNLGVLIVPG